DLVEAQLRIASGEGLPWRQNEITQRGHAIECRLCCEDPYQDFRPATGKVRKLIVPQGDGVRFDSGVAEGQSVSAAFDSMIGKLVCCGEDRASAVAAGIAALREFVLLGVDTNIDYLG